MFLTLKLLFNENKHVPLGFMEIDVTAYQAITSRYSTCILTPILPPHIRKSLTYKAFLNPFRYKVFTLLPAKLHTQHDASAEKDPPAGLSLIHSPVLDRV